MVEIQTASRGLATARMGRTLIHEHVHVGMPGWQFDVKAPPHVRGELIERAVDKLQELHHHGCNTIVDPCPMDLGRDVEFVAEVAQRSGTNIIVCTGVYTEAEGIPVTFRTMPREDILALFVREITEGIGNTGIRAGAIKIASGDDLTNAYEEKMIGVAAEASRLTGVPIISHTHFASHGHNQLDIIERHGGHAGCAVIGHSGDRDDPDYQNSLAERGTFVGLDRFGLEMVLPDDVRIRNLMQLVAAGHRERIVVSHDHALCVLGRNTATIDDKYPNWRITRIFEYVLPRLRELGLPEQDIEQILVANPRNLFENAAAAAAVPDRRQALHAEI